MPEQQTIKLRDLADRYIWSESSEGEVLAVEANTQVTCLDHADIICAVA